MHTPQCTSHVCVCMRTAMVNVNGTQLSGHTIRLDWGEPVSPLSSLPLLFCLPLFRASLFLFCFFPFTLSLSLYISIYRSTFTLSHTLSLMGVCLYSGKAVVLPPPTPSRRSMTVCFSLSHTHTVTRSRSPSASQCKHSLMLSSHCTLTCSLVIVLSLALVSLYSHSLSPSSSPGAPTLPHTRCDGPHRCSPPCAVFITWPHQTSSNTHSVFRRRA